MTIGIYYAQNYASIIYATLLLTRMHLYTNHAAARTCVYNGRYSAIRALVAGENAHPRGQIEFKTLTEGCRFFR